MAKKSNRERKVWNNEKHVYEMLVNGKFQREVEKPIPDMILTGERMVRTLMKLGKPSYSLKKLTPSALDTEIANKTRGANDLRDAKRYGALESPIVYCSERTVNKVRVKSTYKRVVRRESSLYLTLIYKDLWNEGYDKGVIDNWLNRIEKDLKARLRPSKRSLWDDFGWKKTPPPEPKKKKAMSVGQWLNMLWKIPEEEEEEKTA